MKTLKVDALTIDGLAYAGLAEADAHFESKPKKRSRHAVMLKFKGGVVACLNATVTGGSSGTISKAIHLGLRYMGCLERIPGFSDAAWENWVADQTATRSMQTARHILNKYGTELNAG